MKIVVVTHYFPEHGGGIEIVAQQIALRFARAGHSITWFATKEPVAQSTVAPGAFPVSGVNLIERCLGVPYPLWNPIGLMRLLRAVRGAQVVHAHDCVYMGSVAASLGSRLFGTPLLVTQHVGEVPFRRVLFRRALELANSVGLRVLNRASAVVFVSANTQSYFESLGLTTEKRGLIPNGVDRTIFKPLAPDERDDARTRLGWARERAVFLFVGRFVEKKGLALMRGLAEQMPQPLWCFVGWGPEDPGNWHLPNAVSLGRLTHAELALVYAAADLLVLPSVGEGFPLVVQESMASGTPVAVSSETAKAIAGLEDVVWHAPPDLRAFRLLLEEIAADQSALQKRRADALAFAESHWSWDVCAEAYRAVERNCKD